MEGERERLPILHPAEEGDLRVEPTVGGPVEAVIAERKLCSVAREAMGRHGDVLALQKGKSDRGAVHSASANFL